MPLEHKALFGLDKMFKQLSSINTPERLSVATLLDLLNAVN